MRTIIGIIILLAALPISGTALGITDPVFAEIVGDGNPTEDSSALSAGCVPGRGWRVVILNFGQPVFGGKDESGGARRVSLDITFDPIAPTGTKVTGRYHLLLVKDKDVVFPDRAAIMTIMRRSRAMTFKIPQANGIRTYRFQLDEFNRDAAEQARKCGIPAAGNVGP